TAIAVAGHIGVLCDGRMPSSTGLTAEVPTLPDVSFAWAVSDTVVPALPVGGSHCTGYSGRTGPGTATAVEPSVEPSAKNSTLCTATLSSAAASTVRTSPSVTMAFCGGSTICTTGATVSFTEPTTTGAETVCRPPSSVAMAVSVKRR